MFAQDSDAGLGTKALEPYICLMKLTAPFDKQLLAAQRCPMLFSHAPTRPLGRPQTAGSSMRPLAKRWGFTTDRLTIWPFIFRLATTVP